ncbi:hypothetical protein JN403_15665 [Pseudomonas sp. 15A4]|uniref:hypothetical protein n=1 Tax=Pseudomonas sp. 15A4 TaxID=2804761 RepID=UPI001966E88A|nr:hypothetical protein [Pseudomonas sp. 15A4]QSB18034.1 hypothetical protein JN403_15665 [Pseudomonas sp. 15A4]
MRVEPDESPFIGSVVAGGEVFRLAAGRNNIKRIGLLKRRHGGIFHVVCVAMRRNSNVPIPLPQQIGEIRATR